MSFATAEEGVLPREKNDTTTDRGGRCPHDVTTYRKMLVAEEFCYRCCRCVAIGDFSTGRSRSVAAGEGVVCYTHKKERFDVATRTYVNEHVFTIIGILPHDLCRHTYCMVCVCDGRGFCSRGNAAAGRVPPTQEEGIDGTNVLLNRRTVVTGDFSRIQEEEEGCHKESVLHERCVAQRKRV